MRDDKPGIIFPGYWTCSPGGTVEAGEHPEAAIMREMAEEFNVELADIAPLNRRLLAYYLEQYSSPADRDRELETI